jgi:hypothetical protein
MAEKGRVRLRPASEIPNIFGLEDSGATIVMTAL